MGATGGKHYLPTKILTDSSCILADRRLTSIRQQSNQVTECVVTEIAALPSTIFCKRQKVRSNALSSVLKQLRSADALQLCYNGRFGTKEKVKRYVLPGQFTERSKAEKVISEILSPQDFVTSEVLFDSIFEVCGNPLQNVYFIMAHTATGINPANDQK